MGYDYYGRCCTEFTAYKIKTELYSQELVLKHQQLFRPFRKSSTVHFYSRPCMSYENTETKSMGFSQMQLACECCRLVLNTPLQRELYLNTPSTRYLNHLCTQ